MNKKCMTGVMVVGVLILLSGCKERGINNDVYPSLVKTSNLKEDFSRTNKETERILDNHTKNDQSNNSVDHSKVEPEEQENSHESTQHNTHNDSSHMETSEDNQEKSDEEDKVAVVVDEEVNEINDEEILDEDKMTAEDEAEQSAQDVFNAMELVRVYTNTYFYQLINSGDSVEFQVNSYDPTIPIDENTFFSSNAHHLVKVQVNNKVLEEIDYKQNYWYDYNSKFIAYVDNKGALIYYNRYTKKKKDLHAYNIAYLRVIDNCIYYYSGDEKALYCYKNGQHRKIVEGNMSHYEIVGNKVYFGDAYLYRANLDGTNIERISEAPINALISVQDEIYYINDLNVDVLYRISNDDVKAQLLGIAPNVETQDYFTDGDKLYIHYKDQGQDYVKEINSDILNVNEKVFERDSSITFGDNQKLVDDWLYFTENSKGYPTLLRLNIKDYRLESIHGFTESSLDSPLDYITDNNYLVTNEEYGQGAQAMVVSIYAISPHQLVKNITDCKKIGFIWKNSIYYIANTNNEVKKYDVLTDSMETIAKEDYPIEELYLENATLYYGTGKENMKEILLDEAIIVNDELDEIDKTAEKESNPADE